MKIARSLVNVAFVSIGFQTAEKWAAEKLESRLEALPKTLDDLEADDKPDADSAEMKTLTALRTAVEAGEKVECTNGETAEKPAKKAKKEKAVEPEADEEEEKPKAKKDKKAKAKKTDDDEDEPEEKPAKKKAKKSDDDDDEEKPAKAKGRGNKEGVVKVGVIAHLVTMLKDASKAEPITKKDMLKGLVAQFPDREADGMKVTINSQIPARLAKAKNLNIKKVESEDGPTGYYLGKAEKKVEEKKTESDDE